jgi:peptidoglycan/LPS O-acetylase OafA/YrhL
MAESWRLISNVEKTVDDDENDEETHRTTTSPTTTSSFHISSRAAKRLLFHLLPTFIQSRLRPPSEPKPVTPTAWLDGMRGLAAFFVFLDHLSYSTHDVYTAWGTDGANRELLKLPFIRFFYTGAAMVAIFFVVSGYALSYKPVRLMRNGDWEALTGTFSSSVFRRALRLYLPCFASTLMIVLFVRLGLYEGTRELANDAVRFPVRREHHPWRYDTLSEQLIVWMRKMCSFVYPFTLEIKEGDSAIDIDGHLWTIAVEYVSFFLSLLSFFVSLNIINSPNDSF